MVLLRHGTVVALQSVRLDAVEERVYNFHVAELQNYAVGISGVLVHNANDPPGQVGPPAPEGPAQGGQPGANPPQTPAPPEPPPGGGTAPPKLKQGELFPEEVPPQSGGSPPAPSGATAPPGSGEWVRPKGWRLPKNGTWEGTPGNSNFRPNNPAELGLEPGEVVPFRNGRPDFSKWSKGNFTSREPLTGDPVSDRTKMLRTIAAEKGWTQQQVEEWLQREGLSLHHAGGNSTQLIPSQLHGNRTAVPPIPGLSHMGGAFDLRQEP
jgi:hypothetical protein